MRGGISSAAPAVYHVAQNKHTDDWQGSMMTGFGTLEAGRGTRP